MPVAEPTLEPLPSAVADDVVEPSPSVAPSVVPSLDRDGFASVTTLSPGETVEDAAGNLIAVHGAVEAPVALAAFVNLDLFGASDLLWGTRPPLALDISWCSPGPFLDQSPGFIDFSVASSAEAPMAGDASPFIGHAVVEPAFAVAEPGECSRGWLPMAASGAEGTVIRYSLTQTGGSADGRHLYQWELDDSSYAGLSPIEPDRRLGQSATFRAGRLLDTSVTFLGWAEFFNRDGLDPMTRPVGVLVEVCPGPTSERPQFGLGFDGWNLIGTVEVTSVSETQRLNSNAAACNEGWVEFDVPLGVVPTGFFASDSADPVAGFASWTLDDAAIAPPD